MRDINPFVDLIHADLRDVLTKYDQKAYFFCACFGAVLAYLADKLEAARILSANKSIGGVAWVGLLAALLLMAGVFAGLMVIRPRKGATIGPLGWPGLAEMELATLESEIKNHPNEVDLNSKLSDCLNLALICKEKHQNLTISIWTGMAGLIGAVSYLAFRAVG